MLESNDTGETKAPNDCSPYRLPSGESHQRLVFTRGASRVTLESMEGGSETIEADFDGAPGRVSRAHDEVRIGFDWSFLAYAYDVLLGGPTELPHATLRLSETHIWDISCRGGVADLDAHLERVTLKGISIQGGAQNVCLSLGQPRGVVPLRIRGGLSHLEVFRPEGVGVRLSVRGGLARLGFDAMELGAVGGGLSLHSKTGADAADRYEIEIGGGVSDLLIARR